MRVWADWQWDKTVIKYLLQVLIMCLWDRYALGSVMMVGVAPEYLGVWLVWRGVSLALPPWVYQWGDDKLYSLYQRLVLFFFETCTRVEVSN